MAEELNWFGQRGDNRVRTTGMWVDAPPQYRQLMGIPEGGMPLEEFVKFSSPQAQADSTPQPGFFTSIKRGTKSVGEDLSNAAALVSQIAQLPDVQAYFNQKAEEYRLEAEALPRDVPGIEDIHGPADFLTWGIETLGEQVPFLASLLIPGAAVGRGVSLASRAAKTAEALMAAGKVAEAANVLNKASKLSSRAAWSAGFLADVGLMTGESVGIAKDAEEDPANWRVMGSGIGKAMLDFLPFFAIAKQTGLSGIFEKQLVKHAVDAGYLKRAAGNAAVIMATEIPTETIQEWINIELDNYFTGYDGPITDEQKSQLYNAAAGAALFGVLGAYAPKRPPPAGLTEGDTLIGEDRRLPLLPPEDQHEFKFNDIPTGDASGVDFRHFYDPKTGELKVAREDYLRIVKEQSEYKYDPLTDTVKQPSSTAHYTTITPGWVERGNAWYLDPPESNVDAGKATIVQDEQGFSGWDVYGNHLGSYPDLQTAMVNVANGVYSKGKRFVFGGEGLSVEGEENPHTVYTRNLGSAVTPIEQAAVAIDQQIPTRLPNTLRSVGEAETSLIANDPQMLSLLEVRSEFLANKENYRTTDGSLKKGAEAKLKTIEMRIAQLAKIKGLANPTEVNVRSVEGEKIETTLGEQANADAAKAAGPKYANLSAFQSKLYDKLIEKEQFEGLTDKEYEDFQRLQQKVKEGTEVFGVYREASAEELKQFSEEEQKMLQRVKRQRSRYSKATRAIAAMRGVKASKGSWDWKKVAGDKGDVLRGASMQSKGNWKSLSNTVFANTLSFDGFDITWISPKNNAMIGEAQDENGNTIYRLFKEYRGTQYSLGDSGSFATQVRVAEGATPDFVGEVKNALAQVWRTFPTRPHIYILSTADILNGKVQMTEGDKYSLLESYGIFVQGKPGTLYIHIDKHANVEETLMTLIHEMNAHFGLAATMTKQFYAAILQAYADLNRGRIKWAEERGLSNPGKIAREADMSELADILSADEAIAYFAQENYSGNPLEPFEQNFLDKAVTTVRKWLRWLVIKVLPQEWQRGALAAIPFKDKDVIRLLADTALALRKPMPANLDTRWMTRNVAHSKGPVLAKNVREVLERSVDSHNSVWGAKLAGLFLTPIQMAEHYNLPGVADYMRRVQLWAARKATLQNKPVELLEEWQAYSKRGSSRLSEAILLFTAKSDESGHAIPDEEKAQIFRELGVDKQGQDIYYRMRESFIETINQLEAGLLKQEIRRASPSPEIAEKLYQKYRTNKQEFLDDVAKSLHNLQLGGRLEEISAQMAVMRDRDYFPYMRFGRHAIWVRAKTDQYLNGKKFIGPRGDKRGQMVFFETHETYKEMMAALEKVKQEYKGFDIGTGWVSDQEHSMMGMPPALYATLEGHLDLTQAQKELLKEIYYTKSPGQRFLRNMVNRKGIKGFSQDVMRVYSSYMLNAANHIARIEHGLDMDTALAEIRNHAVDGGIVAGHVSDYYAKHYKYIMNPENDWAGLRAVGFNWFLGFNVKSAFVNLTQVPLVALPYLSGRFGDKGVVPALMSAYGKAAKIIKGKGMPDAALQADLERAISEGFIDEGFSTAMAGFSESSVLQRLAPESDAQRRLNQVSWASSFLFRYAEKYNRYVTFIAARDLAMQKGMNAEQAYAEAKEAVQSSMFEYAKWNRPLYSRGKRSVLFLFWNYMQHMSYLMGGGKGSKIALRVWAMMLLAAGLQGIPFAENILDLLDFGSREVKEMLGMKDPYTDLRLELRELAQTITDNPDMLLHGWSRHFGLGPIHLLALAGVPVPEVDTSGSLSAGRWLPGTDSLTGTDPDPDRKLGRALVDILGPVAGMGYGFMRALTDSNPDTWKVWERAMPSALKSVSQYARRKESGGETFKGGGLIAKFDPNNAEDRTSLVLNALGFQPTKVSQSYEITGMKENLRRYWSTRRAMAIENYAFARFSDDPESMADAREALQRFNEDAPDPRLRITGETIQKSMRQRLKKIDQRESGLPSARAFVPLYQQVDRSFGPRTGLPPGEQAL